MYVFLFLVCFSFTCLAGSGLPAGGGGLVVSEAYPHTRVTQPMKWGYVRPPAKQ